MTGLIAVFGFFVLLPVSIYTIGALAEWLESRPRIAAWLAKYGESK